MKAFSLKRLLLVAILAVLGHVGSARAWGPGLTPPIPGQTQSDGFLEQSP